MGSNRPEQGENVEQYRPLTGEWCDGCFGRIGPQEGRIYRGWQFTGTSWFPPRSGDTTHTYSACQAAYVARKLMRTGRGAWSQRRVAHHYKVSRHRVRQWLARSPFDPVAASGSSVEAP